MCAGSTNIADDPPDSLTVRLGSAGRRRLAWQVLRLSRRSLTAGQYSVGVWTLAAWWTAFLLVKEHAPTAFYSTGAGVITTLLLALSLTAWWFRLEPIPKPETLLSEELEARDDEDTQRALTELEGRALADLLIEMIDRSFGQWIRLISRWLFRLVYGIGLLATLFVGEMFALMALMARHPGTTSDARPVFAAIAAGLVGVGLSALLGSREAQPPAE